MRSGFGNTVARMRKKIAKRVALNAGDILEYLCILSSDELCYGNVSICFGEMFLM